MKSVDILTLKAEAAEVLEKHPHVRHLTDMAGQTVRCLTILEEAQTMLGDRTLDDRDVFVRWVKEGRKYGLGCILVTQQPSSISNQIISQGDNFFVLHLLNEGDLQTLRRHNAYFSDDIDRRRSRSQGGA